MIYVAESNKRLKRQVTTLRNVVEKQGYTHHRASFLKAQNLCVEVILMAPSAYPSLSWSSMQMAALSVAMLYFSVRCGTSLTFSRSPLVAGSLRGSIHGGQQPISGAHIQLYAAGTTGNGMAGGELIEAPVVAAPVATDANGNFTITGDYTCPSSSSQLYIIATGGNPGLAAGTNNSALALMAALGPCSLHGGQYTLDPNSLISINEVTTVASMYALLAFVDGDGDDLGASERKFERIGKRLSEGEEPGRHVHRGGLAGR